MGRWSSIVGVLMSIGTAYSLFYFSNILEYLQVLVYFFIVPLFGVVLLGMLWKRCTPAGGFWGFLAAMLLSMSMWVFVHTFPEGFQPQPKVVIGEKAVVGIEKGTDADGQNSDKIVVYSGTVATTNVPIPAAEGKEPISTGEFEIKGSDTALPTKLAGRDEKTQLVRVLAPEVLLADTKEPVKFSEDGLPVVLKPGVKVKAVEVNQRFYPAEFNPAHTKYIARSEKAKGMAVNMYSAFWTLCVSILVAIIVSLNTKPKSDAELKNLVMGLTPLPDEGPCPWHQRPVLWAVVVFIVLIVINVIFW
jgi:solute:Na+ symporter, SSS family